MPKFSVVIPTYNRERFITKAIDSVLRQSFTDYEIIVIDDGSSDDTRTVLAPYMEKIHYIYQENSGVSAARNAGIREAKGEWISFLDSDDEWFEDYLAVQIAQAAQYPDAVAHITNFMNFLPDRAGTISHFEEINLLPKFGQEGYLFLEKPFRMIIHHSHWFLQPIIMRRDILTQTRLLDPDLSIAEDLDIVARMALKGPFTFCRKVLVGIHRREETTASLSSQYVKNGIYSRKAFGKVYTNLMELPGLTLMEKLTLSKALGIMWRALGNLLLKTGRRSEARHYYRKSLFLHPSIKSVIKYLATFLPRQVSLFLVRKGREIVPGEDASGELP